MPAAPLEFIHEFMYVFILEKEKKFAPFTTLRFLHLMLIGTLIKLVFITWLKCYSMYIKQILFVRFCFPERNYCDIVCFHDEIKKGIFNQHYTVLRRYVRFLFPWGLAFCNAT